MMVEIGRKLPRWQRGRERFYSRRMDAGEIADVGWGRKSDWSDLERSRGG
jgi:hypothetical protein